MSDLDTSAASAGIVTPEAVVLDVVPAGVASRAIAFSLDLLIRLQLFAALVVLAIPLANVLADWVGIAWSVVALSAVIFAYPIVFESLARGRTPGKMACGLRVISIEGGPVQFRQSATRSFVALIDIWLTLGVVGILSMLVSPRGQRLGDLAAGTEVIRERAAGGLARPVYFTPPWGYEAIAASLDPTGVSSREYDEIRRVLLRVFDLGPDARSSIVARMAATLQRRHGHVVHPELHPEAYLICVASAYQQYHGVGPPALRDRLQSVHRDNATASMLF